MTFSRRILLPACFVLAALFATTNWLYWPYVLRSGVLNPEADSVIIPMVEGALFAPVLAGLLALWAWPALRGALDRPRLTAWNRGNTVRSLLGTSVYGGAAAVIAIAMLSLLMGSSPWFDAIWLLFLGPLFLWNLLLRAAFVDRPASKHPLAASHPDAAPHPAPPPP